jgi:uncharacterized protein
LNQTEKWVGVGLRKEHYSYLETHSASELDFFELLSENHLDSRGRPWQIVEKMSQSHPLSVHGVGLNIGSAEPLDLNYLEKLSSFINRFEPFLISDHLCWTGHQQNQLHNLLPLSYQPQTLRHLIERVKIVQNRLGRAIALENISAYFQFKADSLSEAEFITQLAEKAECFILLDINNLYVNAINQAYDPLPFLKALPKARIQQYHLAGFTPQPGFLFDSHSQAVWPEVWDLYREALHIIGPRPTLIEWDQDLPPFKTLSEEALKARLLMDELP